MLNPTSRVYSEINMRTEQKKTFERNEEDALHTALNVIANLSKADTTVETVKSVGLSLKDTYYNKFKKDDIIYDASIAPEGTDPAMILNDDALYVNVAKGLPADMTYVEIAGVRKNAANIIKVSIGMSAYIHAPMWKIDDEGVLKVAIPYICAGVDPVKGTTTVTAGGINYEVPVAEPLEKGALEITKAVIQTKTGCAGSIAVRGSEVDVVLGHKGQMAGVVFRANGAEILDTSLPIYVITGTGSVSITYPETCDSEMVTYAFYTFPYANHPVTEEENGQTRDLEKTIAIPGYGSINLTIHGTLLYTPAE